MGTTGVSHRRPPVQPGGQVDGDEVIYSRDMRMTNRNAFEAELADWVGRYMSRGRVATLMRDASGLDEVIRYLETGPVTMNLDGKRRIQAHLIYGRTSDGGWWVRGVAFSLQDSMSHIAAAKRTQLRERLESAALDRAAKKPPPGWKLYFVPPRGCGDFVADAKAGDKIVQDLLSAAHTKAKELEPMLKNPIGPDPDSGGSIALETGKAVLGTFAGLAGDYAREGINTFGTVADGATKVGENVKEKNAGKALGDALDFGVGLATGGNPLSGLSSAILGSLIEIAIASDAGRVARARGRLYVFYFNGLLSQIVNLPADKPSTKAEQDMLRLGKAHGQGLTPCGKYQLQVALLHYVATHNVTNAWSFQTHIDKGWIFPTDYQANWSPSVLAHALAWQVGKLKYLIK